MANQNATELSEQLFQAIDAIVIERLRVLPYDKTVVATIIENKDAPYGKYRVTTDDNITFYAYADIATYPLQEKVYVRIPQNDYTKQKVITGRYIQENRPTKITEVKSEEMTLLKKNYNKQLQTLQDELTAIKKQME